jgi:uncharacterized protein
MSGNVHIAVFCRPLIAGQVKTRLIPAYGEAGAMRIYQHLVERTLATVSEACSAIDASASLWVAGDCNHPSIVELSRRFQMSVYPQTASDLGERMFQCLSYTTKMLARNALLIGTDCPAFTSAHIIDAASALNDETPWVFTPAEDGGYVLVGTNAPTFAPFENVEWGTALVMAQTRAALRRAARPHAELRTLWDVDLPGDVARAQRADLLGDIA